MILLQGRSGSQLLASMLNNHPAIHCDGELLSPKYVHKLQSVTRYLRGRTLCHQEPVFGFRLKWMHLLCHRVKPEQYLNKMIGSGWQFIYSRRRNLLQQTLSFMIASRRGRWRDQTANPLSNRKFHIDCEQLLQNLEKQERWRLQEKAFLKAVPHLDIVYEDDLLLTKKHQSTLDRILAFLQLSSIPAQTDLVKTGSKNLADDIDNYDEVVGTISRTKYATYLEA